MSTSKKVVMITGGGGAGNEAIFRLLSDRYELYFVDSNISNIDPTIPFDNKREIPLATDKKFLEALKKLCIDLQVDLLVPSVDEELLLIAKSGDDFGETQIMLPHASYIEEMSDKLGMIRALENQGILAPETESLDQDITKFVFPSIVKPREGRGSRGVFSVSNAREVQEFREKIGDDADRQVLQRQYFGVEYTVQMIANYKKELLCTVPVKISVKKGITISAEVDDNQLVRKACELIHQKVPCAGTYNIQLILTADNKVYPFEINPRISTTFCLVLAAGVDPIDLFLNGKLVCSPYTFCNGTSLSRHWHNHFV
ncbi:ATP-grasp domain-containing protein [Pseudomonadales bacterium]|nr:ATP-grasp domain-containing protein [Pseudomonadales bacterium]